MNLHANAALSLNGRRRMVACVVEEGRSLAEAASAAGASERTCRKWVARYRREGDAGLLDRSSAPRHVANRTDRATVDLSCALRRLRFTAPELADLLGLLIPAIRAM
ncbi:MAG: leucine zipper domain-containing protein [Patulibacter sp.]